MSVMGVVRNPTSGKPNAGPNHRPCQYIRGQGLVADDLDGAQIVSRGLSGPAVSYDFVADLLAITLAIAMTRKLKVMAGPQLASITRAYFLPST